MSDAGIKEIDQAQWEADEYGTQFLRVHDYKGHLIEAWLALRPPYCDRGHIQLCVDGPIGVDGADNFPRFFFSFEEANQHARDFLKWRLWKHSPKQTSIYQHFPTRPKVGSGHYNYES